MTDANQLLPVLSLTIALVAAVGGPLVALKLGRNQSRDAQQIANLQADVQRRVASHQIIAPMRQAWINSLRDLVSEISARADMYRISHVPSRNLEQLASVAVLENKLRLLINPLETDHEQLVELVRVMLAEVEGASGQGQYWRAKDAVFELTQKILKAEWIRAKGDLN